jgi:hypothetical protein
VAPTIFVRMEAEGFVARDEEEEVLAEGAWKDAAARERLATVLRVVSSPPELREPDGSSRVTLVVEGARETRWVHVQWLMQLAAAADVKIWKIQFTIREGP